MHVRLFSNFASSTELMNWVHRQTPTTFFVNRKMVFTDKDIYTHAVVFNWTKEKITSPKEHNIAFIMEPLEIRRVCDRETLKPERYDSIARIYTPTQDDKAIFTKKHRFYPSQILLFADICKDSLLVPSKKHRRMSIVCSFKRLVPLQIKRVAVINKLLQSSLNIDFYGRDFPSCKDSRVKGPLPMYNKHEALRPYQYSLAFENTVCPEVLTEKFQDCIVNHAVPISNNPGCLKYFPDKSSLFLNFDNSIETLLEQIRFIYYYDDVRRHDIPIMQAKSQILSGSFSIAENMYRALKSQI